MRISPVIPDLIMYTRNPDAASSSRDKEAGCAGPASAKQTGATHEFGQARGAQHVQR